MPKARLAAWRDGMRDNAIICHAVFGIIRAFPGTRAVDRRLTPDHT
jgi:hypothetical protein